MTNRGNGRTPVQQSERKIEGTLVERQVKADILKKNKKINNIIVNTRSGIDLFVKNGETIKIEVKSAREREFVGIIEGKMVSRSGRFLIKEEDYLKSDVFAFVVKKVDATFKWDARRRLDVMYVSTKTVQDYLKNPSMYNPKARGSLFRKYKQVKIPIEIVKKLPRFDPSNIYTA